MNRPHGDRRLNPGHEAGLASVRRYRSARRAVMPQILVGMVAAVIVFSCLSLAAALSGGDASASGVLDGLFGIDVIEAAAILAALLVSLYVGVPMGMYIHGLLGGYEPLDRDRY